MPTADTNARTGWRAQSRKKHGSRHDKPNPLVTLEQLACEHGAKNLGIRTRPDGQVISFSIAHVAYGYLKTIAIVANADALYVATLLLRKIEELRQTDRSMGRAA